MLTLCTTSCGRALPRTMAEPICSGCAISAERVQLHPCTGAWMRGDRYGEIVRETAETVTVKMDRSGKTRRYPQAFVLTLDGGPR